MPPRVKSTKGSKRTKSVSPSAKSEAGGEEKKKESQTRKKNFAKRFDWTLEAHQLPLTKSLKQNVFKQMISTIKQDVHNLYTVTAYTYGTGEYDHGLPYTKWTKKYSREVLRQVLKRLDLVPEYHHVKRAGSTGGTQLQMPFYVFQNFYDWINEVNMGNGLAGLLVHLVKKADKRGKPYWEANYRTFLDYVNQDDNHGKTLTRDEVLNDLLYVHARGKVDSDFVKTESESVSKPYFDDGKGKGTVNPDDATVQRIVEVRNAYVRTYNSKLPQGEPELVEITAEEAAAMAVPQSATIAFSDGEMKTSEVLNTTITTSDGETYRSSAINSGMSTAILALMTSANNLTKSKGAARSGGYIEYDLFAKYFHNKGAKTVDGKREAAPYPTYAPGKDAGFYLGGKKLDLGIDTNLEGDNLKGNIARRFPSLASGKKTTDQNGPLAKVTFRVGRAYGRKTDTIFELIAKMKSGKGGENKASSFVEKNFEGTNDYGITNFSATQLVFLNKIPKEFLDPKTQASLNTDLFNRVKAVQKYLSTINMAYSAYRAQPSKKSSATPSRAAASPRKPRSRSASPTGGAPGSGDDEPASPLPSAKARKPKPKLSQAPSQAPPDVEDEDEDEDQPASAPSGSKKSSRTSGSSSGSRASQRPPPEEEGTATGE